MYCGSFYSYYSVTQFMKTYHRCTHLLCRVNRSSNLCFSDTFEGLLWCAPEILRDNFALPRGTQKGDIYSFAIILQECHTRNGPWSENELGVEGRYSIIFHFDRLSPYKQINYFGSLT